METIGAPLLSIQGNRSRHGQYMATEGRALSLGPAQGPGIGPLGSGPWAQGRGAPSRGAARAQRRVPRIPRSTEDVVVGVSAHGELGRVGFAEQEAAAEARLWRRRYRSEEMFMLKHMAGTICHVASISYPPA